MQLNIELAYNKPILPVSTNKSHYKIGTLTKESRAYRNSTFMQLIPIKEQLKTFREYALNRVESSNPAKYCIQLVIKHYIPSSRFYTLKGKMSKTAGDADNYTKLLQDFLFNERYMAKEYTCNDGSMACNLAINDAFIKQCNASMQPHDADDWVIRLNVSIIAIADL